MIRKPSFFITAFVIAAVCAFTYFHYRIPLGVTPQSDSSEKIALIALITAIVSLLSAITGLIQKIIELLTEGTKQ